MNINQYLPELPSLEAAVDGQQRQELEYAFFGRLTDLTVLDKAFSSERQEQWEIVVEKSPENAVRGTLRVRKVNDDVFIFTSKTMIPGVKGKSEVELESTEAQFNQFRDMASGGMIKRRYLFPVKGTEGTWTDADAPHNGCLVWELDVYLDEQENPKEWVKVDLEVPSEDTKVPALPFKLEDLITAPYDKRTPEENAILDKLFKTVFISKNPKASPAQ